MLDLVIKNGIIIDGSGLEKYQANIGIKKNKIKIISKSNLRGRESIDVQGLYIAPGFVDILNHSDGYLTIFDNPEVSSMILQGVTTIVCGNCGTSLAPLAPLSTIKEIFKSSFTKQNIVVVPSKGENVLKNIRRWTGTSGFNITWITFQEYLQEIKKKGLACNFATLVGYNTCRRIVVGDEVRDISYEEMKMLKRMLEDSLSNGAFGISIGLSYSHAKYIKTKEIQQLFSILKKDRKMCAIHLRDEGDGFLSSLKEAFDVASKSNISLEVSHLKIPKNISNADKVLDNFNNAKKKGLNINFDFYPYRRAWTALYSYLPEWIVEGGKKEMLKRLGNQNNFLKIREDIKRLPYNFKKFVITSADNKALIGKTIENIAFNQNKSIEKIIVELLLSNKNNLNCFSNDEFVSADNLYKQAKNEHSIVSSGGAAYNLDSKNQEQLVHPRCFGAFPKFLRDFVVDKKIINWEEAIKKITYMPAQKVGLFKRGLIEKGYFADLVILDPNKICSRANCKNPYIYPDGINYVIVNGKIAAKGKRQEKNLSGRVLEG